MKTPIEKTRLDSLGQKIVGAVVNLERYARNGDVNAQANVAIISSLEAINIELKELNRNIEMLIKK
jgi:hypothetical protein